MTKFCTVCLNWRFNNKNCDKIKKKKIIKINTHCHKQTKILTNTMLKLSCQQNFLAQMIIIIIFFFVTVIKQNLIVQNLTFPQTPTQSHLISFSLT